MKLTTKDLIRIEMNLRWAVGQLGPLLKKELAEDLKTVDYVMSMLRHTSQKLDDSPNPQDQYTTLLDLKGGLFK